MPPVLTIALALVAATVGVPATAAAAAGVSAGHSGWEWSNPLPQGNSLGVLDFDGQRGYAAGEFGTLLRTDDGGSSWIGLSTLVTEDLTDVQAFAPDSVVVAGGCAVRRSDDGGLSFDRLAWTDRESPCRNPIAAVAFPGPSVAYILLENGRVYRSGDGGTSWNRAAGVPLEGSGDLPPTDAATDAASDVFFVAEDAGVATTGRAIYRTVDGGLSWSRAAARQGGFAAVTFATPAVGYAVGGATVWRSMDGGATWLQMAVMPGTPDLTAVDCADALRCVATTAAGDRVLWTQDGGLTWGVTALGAGRARAAALASRAAAVAAGDQGGISLSDDRGETWTPQPRGLPGGFTRLCGAPGSLAFAIGRRGAIARTSDAGQTWSMLTPPSSEDLLDVSFTAGGIGFAIDVAGSLWRTDDAGVTWRGLDPGRPAQPQAVLALDGERVLLAGPTGLRRSTNGGESFRGIRRRAVRRSIIFDLDRAGGWVFAHGPRLLLSSPDGGRSWRKLERPDNRPLGAVDFVTARTGFALGKGGRLWRTRDRGVHWKELLATGTDGATEIAFSSARNGYVVSNDIFFARGSGRPDYVLRTSDGGITWRPQLVLNSSSVNGLVATSPGVDFLLAGDSQLLATTTGGDRGVRASLRLRGPRRALARPGKAAITGRLRPADGGEQVVVSKATADRRRRPNGVDWDFKSVRVRGDGSFATSWRVRRTSVFVAQWTGDGARTGAGSRILKVRVRRR